LRLREVAERMGRSREAVKKLYARALSRFAEILEQTQGGSHA
jgi:DNA-directed RNA polymerase specialized sigma24 family protein